MSQRSPEFVVRLIIKLGGMILLDAVIFVAFFVWWFPHLSDGHVEPPWNYVPLGWLIGGLAVNYIYWRLVPPRRGPTSKK
jgi:hypothetical protein